MLLIPTLSGLKNTRSADSSEIQKDKRQERPHEATDQQMRWTCLLVKDLLPRPCKEGWCAGIGSRMHFLVKVCPRTHACTYRTNALQGAFPTRS